MKEYERESMWYIRGEKKYIKHFGWKPKGIRQLGRAKRRKKIRIKIDLQETVLMVLT
jgi:hypothetical protein